MNIQKMIIKDKKSVQEYVGIQEITENGVLTINQGELVFFRIKPINIAVLSQSTISAKVFSLMSVLKNISEFQICCLNSSESFDENKAFLLRRIEEEDNPVIKDLCRKDLEFLDNIQLEMATAREFLFIIRFRAEKPEQIVSAKGRVEKILKEQGFEAKRATKDDIKRILAVYFSQNGVTEQFDDVDGERWVLKNAD
jgi:hypothetical protein